MGSGKGGEDGHAANGGEWVVSLFKWCSFFAESCERVGDVEVGDGRRVVLV